MDYLQQLRPIDFLNVSVFEVSGGVHGGREHPARGPRELVAQRVVGSFGRRQAAADRAEAADQSAAGFGLVDELIRLP